MYTCDAVHVNVELVVIPPPLDDISTALASTVTIKHPKIRKYFI